MNEITLLVKILNLSTYNHEITLLVQNTELVNI